MGEFSWTPFLLFLYDLGIWFWGFDGFIALLPSLNWTRMDGVQRTDGFVRIPEPLADSFHSVQPPQVRESSLGRNFQILTPMYSVFCNNYFIHKGNVNKCLDFCIILKAIFIP